MHRYLSLLLFIGLAWGQTNQVPSTQVVMDSAFETAKNENKHILLIFHTNWCDFCKMLIEGFNNKDSEPFFKESYIITTLNPLDKNHLVNDGAMEYYGELLENDKVGWPSTFIIDKNGNKLDKYYGFPTSDNAIDSLLTVLNNFSQLDKEQNDLYLDILAEYFKNMN